MLFYLCINDITYLYIFFRLDDLHKERDVNSITLIERMVSSKPSERPPTSAILKHPFYWNPERVLNFFQVRARPGKVCCYSLFHFCTNTIRVR